MMDKGRAVRDKPSPLHVPVLDCMLYY